MDNSQNETDTHRFELGPALKAIAFSSIIFITAGVTWYVCHQNTKGDIAESEIEVRKSDNKAASAMEEIHDRTIAIKESEHADKVYTSPWAGKSLRELRESKKH